MCVGACMQVVAGFRFKVRFDLQKTTCAKEDHADLFDLCEVDVDNMVNMENRSHIPNNVARCFPVLTCVSACLRSRSLPTVTPLWTWHRGDTRRPSSSLTVKKGSLW